MRANRSTGGDAEQRIGGPVSTRSLSLRMVFCLAGDATPNAAEGRVLEQLKETDGDGMYAECLRLLVGRRAMRDFAEQEWNTLLSHRSDLEQTLGRPVALQTAALDFFSEARPEKPDLVLMPADVFQRLYQEARVDPTTGLFTPNSFNWALEHEVRRARRYHRCIVLLLIDIDDMQQMIARRGDEYADFVLREVATLINHNIRNTDTAARLDNDTFGVLLHECKLSDGQKLAERMRAAIEHQTFSLWEGDEGAHLTASISLVGYPENGESAEKLMARARELLATAKTRGKNRVEAAEMPVAGE